MGVSREDVLSALEAVPAGAGSLAGSGRLGEIAVDAAGRVMAAIAVLPAEAAAFETVRRAAEDAIRALPGVSGALVSLTADRAPGTAGPGTARSAPAGPGPAAPRPGGPPRPQSIPGVRHVIAVASGKGGVGKSTVSANLAVALAGRGLRVGLMDADIYGPSAPRLFGLSEKPRVISGRLLEPLERYGVKVMSIGFLVEDGAAVIWRGPMVQSAINQLLREVAWGDLDVLLIDMPPGTGDAQLTIAQSTPLAGAVIVSTPQDLALIDARRGVAMFNKVAIPILGVVENMATFVCPHCGIRSDIFGHGGARAEADRMGVPFLGEIPLDMALRETSDAGRPLVAAAPESPNAAAFGRIADAVWGRIESPGAARRAPRIVFE